MDSNQPCGRQTKQRRRRETRRLAARYVVTIVDGVSSHRETICMEVYQKHGLRTAAGFHATTCDEAVAVRSLGFTQPIAVAPYPVRVPTIQACCGPGNATRTVIFLSRIHPKKGLPAFLKAWKRCNLGSRWRLVIAGPDEVNHQAELLVLAMQAGLTQIISFPGSVSDDDKWS